jgi:hypothetical protein
MEFDLVQAQQKTLAGMPDAYVKATLAAAWLDLKRRGLGRSDLGLICDTAEIHAAEANAEGDA